VTFEHGQRSTFLTTRPNLPRSLGYTVGKYYGPSTWGGGIFGPNFTTGSVYYVPFLARKRQAFDRIALAHVSSSTDHFRLAIYADDGGGHPGTRLAESGEITLAGAAADNAAVISVTLDPGLYWLAYTPDTTISVSGFSAGGISWDAYVDLGIFNGTIPTSGATPLGTHGYGQLPSTAVAITAFSTLGHPLIRLRAA